MSYDLYPVLLVAIVFLTSIVVSTLRGFTRNFKFIELIPFVVASRYAADAATLLPIDWSVPTVRLAISFGLLLVGVRLLFALVNGLVMATRAAGLTLADHGMGGLFGFARACVIVLSFGVLAGLTNCHAIRYGKRPLLVLGLSRQFERLNPCCRKIWQLM